MVAKSSLLLVLAVAWTSVAIADMKGRAPSCAVPSLKGGAIVDPAARKGAVIYLDFWASWCSPCAKSFPFLDQLQQELKGRGFEVIAINLDENPRDAQTFLGKHPARFTLASDVRGKCPALYQVKGMPTSYLIDRKGYIRSMHEGFETSDEPRIRKEIESLLSEH
jgi:thiol-disulfide isomerase/thioredoxin